MDHTACTEPQCLYKGALYLYLSACTRVHFTFTSVPVQGCTLPLPQCLYKGALYLYLSACTRVHCTFTSVPVQGCTLPLPFCPSTACYKPVVCRYSYVMYISLYVCSRSLTINRASPQDQMYKPASSVRRNSSRKGIVKVQVKLFLSEP